MILTYFNKIFVSIIAILCINIIKNTRWWIMPNCLMSIKVLLLNLTQLVYLS